jgi:Tol biopolymer transport system component
MNPLATTGTPRWSPDGQSISFDSNADGNTHIYVIKADGGRPRALTSGASNNFVSSWSADGRWIYFTSNRSGEPQIWKVPVEGGPAAQVTRQGGEASDVSPDGKWLYFTKNGGVNGIWKMPIDGGEETRLIESVFRYNYAIARDGLYFVPPPGPDRTSSVRYLNFATGGTNELVKIEKPVDLGLAVSPDGTHLLFCQLDYVGQDLMLVENFE